MKNKLIKWIKRYGPAEIVGTMGAYLGAFLAYNFSNNKIIAAYSATMGENLGFYGTIFFRELRTEFRLAKQDHEKYKIKDLLRTMANLFIDFGPAEALDSLIIRPASIGTGVYFLGEKAGVIVGKLAADVTFYVPAIISYELREHFMKKQK